jgi:hypothetical protein
MDLFERSKDRWIAVYIDNQKNFINSGMTFGRMMAEGLENDEGTGDIELDLVMARIPKFEIRDKSIEAEMKVGKKIVTLLAKPDTIKKDYSAFKEDKTGPRGSWSQKKVDDCGQITFYATVVYVKTGKIPQDIELVHVETEKVDDGSLGGKIAATGEIYRYKTKRNLAQVLNMMVRMKKAQEGIEKLCEEILF